ncbi:MAG TPA: hypothetical protein VES97_00610 [Solirubrobacteraceae bacterium]|nr:hypothetical protein [Solirubrobacteraceae bacterium]
MAYIVARPAGTWEVRESRSTPDGPRSRTLATFRTLTPAVLERAGGRASKPLDPSDLRRAAVRAGAPVAGDDVDRAAGELLGELAAGRAPRPVLRRLLLETLDRERPARTSASARAAARWIAATPQQRGETLRDLLLLADRLPAPRRPGSARFPRLRSRPA